MDIEETNNIIENENSFTQNKNNLKNHESHQANEQSSEYNGANKEKIFILTKIKKHKNWTKEEDKLLIEVANKFKQKSWTKAALYFKDKNPAQCRARYKRIRPGIVKGAWTKEEDQMIVDLVNKSGRNWALISKMMPTRNGKQIRDRFLNYLDPFINKIKFTDDDDGKIIEFYKIYGTKWSKIAKFFDGRTGDMIKNRFYSCLKRKVHIYEVNTNKRIRKKYYKAKRLATATNPLSANLLSFNSGSSALSKPIYSQNISKLDGLNNSINKRISNKIIISNTNGKTKILKDDDVILFDKFRNKENKCKPSKNIFKAVREETLDSKNLEKEDFDIKHKNEDYSELKENLNKFSRINEFNNFNEVKNNCLPNMGINNHINFLINANNTSGMNSTGQVSSSVNISSTPFQLENYYPENQISPAISNLLDLYYNVLATSGVNYSNLNIEQFVAEMLSKNFENINNFNILTLSKILNIKSQLERGINLNSYNNQNNYANSNMNNFYNLYNMQRMVGLIKSSPSELNYLMGLNCENNQKNTMSNSNLSSNLSPPN